jgi:hypothetical protein
MSWLKNKGNNGVIVGLTGVNVGQNGILNIVIVCSNATN